MTLAWAQESATPPSAADELEEVLVFGKIDFFKPEDWTIIPKGSVSSPRLPRAASTWTIHRRCFTPIPDSRRPELVRYLASYPLG